MSTASRTRSLESLRVARHQRGTLQRERRRHVSAVNARTA